MLLDESSTPKSRSQRGRRYRRLKPATGAGAVLLLVAVGAVPAYADTVPVSAGTVQAPVTVTEGGSSQATPDAIGQSAGDPPTVTSIFSNVNPVGFGESVTFTAVVAAGGGVPNGYVEFLVNGSYASVASLNSSGNAYYTTASLPLGTDSVQALYEGTGYWGSSESLPYEETVGTGVNPPPIGAVSTTTYLSSNPNPSDVGQPVQLGATVVAANGSPISSGSVTFYVNGSPLTTVGVSNNAAYLDTTGLPAGVDSVVASYSGDGVNFDASTSSTLSQTVEGYTPPPPPPPSNAAVPTTTYVASTPNPSAAGQLVTLGATVEAANGANISEGTMTFLSNGSQIGTAQVVNNQAFLQTASLPAGEDGIVASYSGVGNTFDASSSSVLEQTVGSTPEPPPPPQSIPTFTSLSASPNPATPSEGVSLEAVVGSQDGAPTGGTVSFYNGSQLLAQVPVINGTASYFYSPGFAGQGESDNGLLGGLLNGVVNLLSDLLGGQPSTSYQLSASYSGYGAFLASQSSAYTETVNG